MVLTSFYVLDFFVYSDVIELLSVLPYSVQYLWKIEYIIVIICNAVSGNFHA